MIDRRKKYRPGSSGDSPQNGYRRISLGTLAALAVLLAGALCLTTGCGWGLTFRSYDVRDQSPQPPETRTEDPVADGIPESEISQLPADAETRPSNPEAWGPGAQMSVGRSFDPIYFDAGSSELDFTARNRLKDYAAWLKAHPNVWVTLAGYAADESSDEFSLNLSMARTLIVEDFLLGQGLSPVRLFTISYGDLTTDTAMQEPSATSESVESPEEPAQAADQPETKATAARVSELERRVEILAFIAPIGVSGPEAVLVAPGGAPDSQQQPPQEEPVDIP